jgi:hypothetical protein
VADVQSVLAVTQRASFEAALFSREATAASSLGRKPQEVPNPIHLAWMVHKFQWLATMSSEHQDPIRLDRMVNEFPGNTFCRDSLSNFFTHVASTWGSMILCLPILAIQTASPSEQVRWGRKDVYYNEGLRPRLLAVAASRLKSAASKLTLQAVNNPAKE